MRYIFVVLAHSVWWLHVLWTLLLAVGIALVFVVSWYAPVHLVLVSGTLLLNLALGDCPLTMVERTFYSMAGRRIDMRSFSQRLFTVLGWRLSRSGVNQVLAWVKVGSYTATVLVMVF